VRWSRYSFRRLVTCAIGVLIFYAPFALLVRIWRVIFNTPALVNAVPDFHRVCFLMPLNWFLQPRSWSRFLENPLYLTVALLPLIAFLIGPLFCGWVCPAGGITEFLSRLVPSRWKIDYYRYLEPGAVRYGFLAGFLAVPFLGLSVCCPYCHYSSTQDLLSAVFGDFSGLAYWGSTGLITIGLWFIVLGLFAKGGRGWCSYICPVGAVQNLAHAVGTLFGFTFRLKLAADRCSGCGTCITACPAGAVTVPNRQAVINHHLCNGCLECLDACPTASLRYGRGAGAPEWVTVRGQELADV